MDETTEKEMLDALKACCGGEEISPKDLQDLRPTFVMKIYTSFLKVIVGVDFDNLAMVSINMEIFSQIFDICGKKHE